MADMHRTCRVGGNIFDIDLEALTNRLERPKSTPFAHESVDKPLRQNSGVRRKLRNPGPATEVSATSASPENRAAICSASARGCIANGLDNTIAALVEISPCAGSRGGSTASRSKVEIVGLFALTRYQALEQPVLILSSKSLNTFMV
jgi:hypothetical protein